MFTKRALSIAEVVMATGLSRTKIYQLRRQGVLLTVKIGRRTLILPADLDDFFKRLPKVTPARRDDPKDSTEQDDDGAPNEDVPRDDV